MNLSRRTLLGLGLGAAQMALLERFGLNRASAGPPPGYPTKLLSIWVPGGLNHELIWCPFSDAGVAKFIPPPEGDTEPYFYDAAMVANYDGSAGGDGGYQKVRGPIWWNRKDPSDKATINPASQGKQTFVPYMYSWASKDLGNAKSVVERATMIHGVDQGTAAHASGIIASLCGVAGGDFRAPAIAAVVANAMMKKFPDRPLPSVSIKGTLTPKAVSTSGVAISSAASPIFLSDISSLAHTISDHPDSAWAGLRARHDIDDVGFDGKPVGAKLPVTIVEEAALRAARSMRGRSTAATDAALEELHDTYRGVSRALARDVVDVLTKTNGVEYLPATMPWTPGDGGRFGYVIGYADGGAAHDWDDSFDMVLRLLKSDLASSITLEVPGANNFAYDTHSAPGAFGHVNNLRGTFEVIGRLILEMMLTPSPSQPGKTLLDETLVHVFSDFGRTTSKPNAGTDHHPATTMILIGGGVHGNRMIGGLDETMSSSPLGVPVDILDLESGGTTTTSRVPRAADAAATVLRGFGLEAGTDFFIPGGYGEVAGVYD